MGKVTPVFLWWNAFSSCAKNWRKSFRILKYVSEMAPWFSIVRCVATVVPVFQSDKVDLYSRYAGSVCGKDFSCSATEHSSVLKRANGSSYIQYVSWKAFRLISEWSQNKLSLRASVDNTGLVINLTRITIDKSK